MTYGDVRHLSVGHRLWRQPLHNKRWADNVYQDYEFILRLLSSHYYWTHDGTDAQKNNNKTQVFGQSVAATHPYKPNGYVLQESTGAPPYIRTFAHMRSFAKLPETTWWSSVEAVLAKGFLVLFTS